MILCFQSTHSFTTVNLGLFYVEIEHDNDFDFFACLKIQNLHDGGDGVPARGAPATPGVRKKTTLTTIPKKNNLISQ